MTWGLGNKFDVCSGIMPVADLAAGANTGHRVHMRNYRTLGVVLFKGVASAGTDTLTMTLQEHTLAAAGTSQNLAAITTAYIKSETSPMDGDEAWVEVTQAAAATLALAGATYAAKQAIAMNIADPGTGGTIPGCLAYIPHGLFSALRPDRMPQPNL